MAEGQRTSFNERMCDGSKVKLKITRVIKDSSVTAAIPAPSAAIQRKSPQFE